MTLSRRATFFVALLAAAFAPAGAADLEVGTFSIVARDPGTGELGVAVQSRAFAVGQGVPWARGGVGAIATQASTNESFGPIGLDYMGTGDSASRALARLIGADAGREDRQVGIVDARGRSAIHTGSGCLEWAGGVSRENLACQGNILAGEAVVEEMARAFEASTGPLAERLLLALEAGQSAGGDRRGQQSAALLVVTESQTHPEYAHRLVDLRVDDHSAPIAELRRLYTIFVSTDLVDGWLELAWESEANGRDEVAARYDDYVVGAIHAALAREDVTPGELNALAWVVGTHDVRLDDALLAARRAVEMDASAEVLDTLAEVLWRMERWDEAIETGERALAGSPGDGYLTRQLAKYRASKDAGARVTP